MDPAVGLVQAYLHANGYLTATEYPIVEALRGGGYRTVTDVDILAVRLPGAGRIVPHESGDAGYEERLFDPDPALIDDRADLWVDFIIGEVKEGKAELNRGAREATTLMTALRRFVFLEPGLAGDIVEELLKKGGAKLEKRSIQFRLFAFGSRRGDRARPPYRVVLLQQCLEYLIRIGSDNSLLASAAQIKNPTMNLLTILAKSGFLTLDSAGRRRGRSAAAGKGRRRR